MPPIKKVVAGSRNRKREKRMNATTQAKTRNVYVREIMMPVVFCKDCKYWDYEVDNDVGFCVRTEDCDWNADDFCSKGEKKDESID